MDTKTSIPIEISNRHAHLSKEDIEKLFGKNYELTVLKKLSYPGEFSAKETIKIAELEARIVGPVRAFSQLELSETDSRRLKLNLPVRISGDIKNAPLVEARAQHGKTKIPAIIAKRHIHITRKDSEKLGINEKSTVSIKVEGELAVTFHNIAVRINDKQMTALHLNTDEGNAAGAKEGTKGILIK
jgi:putative phosphotransacetylase